MPATDKFLAALKRAPARQHESARCSSRNADEIASGVVLTSRVGKVTGLRLARYSAKLACRLLRAGDEEAAAGTEHVNVGLASRAVGRRWVMGKGWNGRPQGARSVGTGSSDGIGRERWEGRGPRAAVRRCESRASSQSEQCTGVAVHMVGDGHLTWRQIPSAARVKPQ